MSVSALKYRQAIIIKLSGPLIREFSREHRRQLDIGSTQEAFSALRNTPPGFKEAITRPQHLDMQFAIYRSYRNIGGDEFSTYGVREVRIIPVIASSKRAGLVQTIIGIAMVAIAMVVTGDVGGFAAGSAWGLVGVTGASLALGGVVQTLGPQIQGLKQSTTPENLPSYAFGSAKNTTAGGNPVPIYYGKRRWGGAIISVSIHAEGKT